jgi:hypothetical protein
MFRIIVIPTLEDQAVFVQGKEPKTIISRTFLSEIEINSYVDGLEAVWDQSEYDILDEKPLSILTVFDSEDSEDGTRLYFSSKRAKLAYKQRLTDGDGFTAPLFFRSDQQDDLISFNALITLIDKALPVTF